MKDSKTPKAQVDKFRDMARELECDEDEERFDERLKRIAKAPKARLAHGPKKED